MSEPLPDLESRRSRILLEIAHLDDCRRGSVHAAFRRCGKPNCAYASDDHPGHGPQVRLSFKRHGKTVQQTLSDPAQIRKAEREVAAFRSFQQLSAELVAVNERICQLRLPATQDLEPASAAPKKTLRAIQNAVQAEVASLLRVIVNARRKLGAVDLEALELATRTALHRAGARLLEALLEDTADEHQPPLCTCGNPMRCEGPRPKQLVSLLGTVSLRRPYYHCRHCWRGVTPLDRDLDIEGTQYSPGVRRLDSPRRDLRPGSRVSRKASIRCSSSASAPRASCKSQAPRLLTVPSLSLTEERTYPAVASRSAKPSRSGASGPARDRSRLVELR